MPFWVGVVLYLVLFSALLHLVDRLAARGPSDRA